MENVNESAPILKVEHVKKSFGDLHVLKDISFDLKAGEVLSIIGPSGSGKSTLLRCLTQLETIDGGEVQVAGMNLVVPGSNPVKYAPAKTLREIRLSTGLVFQNFNLFPHLTVLHILNVNGGRHYVLATSCAGNGVYNVNDPAYGTNQFSHDGVVEMPVYH